MNLEAQALGIDDGVDRVVVGGALPQESEKPHPVRLELLPEAARIGEDHER